MTDQQSMEAGAPRTQRKAIGLVLGLAIVVLGSGVAYWQATRSNDVIPVDSPTPKMTPSGPAWFRDITSESGLDFTYRNGEEADHFSILETLGGGVALIDFDRDGLLDVFVTGGGSFDGPDKKQIKGHPSKLYKNLGNFKFKDVTVEVGLGAVFWWYTHGIAVADYDSDGWPDLLVTGYGNLALFHNESDGKNGRHFVDVTKKLGLKDDSWSTSAAWADLDGDGFPDLYVCHYVDWSFSNDVICPGVIPGIKRETCSPHQFKPLVHALFHNEKGKSFRNVSAEHRFRPDGAGLGVVIADLNDDGRPDIFVANDLTPNFLYFNRTPLVQRPPERGIMPPEDGAGVPHPACKLEEKARLAGVDLDEQGKPNGNMGLAAGDYDGSGRPSLWITVYQNQQHVLARNLGRETFLHQSRIAGIAAIGQHFVGFGTGFIDVDNDGWEDLVIANGHIFRNPPGSTPKQRPVLLYNIEHQGRRFFKDFSSQGGPFFETPELGRGLAIGDLDNDGWPDLVISHVNRPLALLRNQAAAGMKQPRHWLGVQLVGKKDRDTVGSTVILETGARNLTRFAQGGGSYLSVSDPRLLFGLGELDKVQRLTVKWAWGQTQTWDNLEPNRYWKLREGEAKAERQ